MMRFCKYIFLFWLTIASAILPLDLRGETVSQKQASQIAATFFNAAYGIYVPKPTLAWNGKQLTTDRLFSPFYIYNHPKGGFVIIAAENKAFPILGYSRTGRFDKNKIPEDMLDLLKQYSLQIEMIRYDYRAPVRAIEAWQNLPMAIDHILNNPYDTPEYRSISDEHRLLIESIDRANDAIMLPAAVEFEVYIPDYLRPYTLDDITAPEEEIPFKFYEDFLAEIRAEEEARLAAYDEIIAPTKPVVSYLGGAHYAISFPETMQLAFVYSIQGSKVQERYFKNTQLLNLDFSALPIGFYVLLAISDEGHIYGIKLYR